MRILVHSRFHPNIGGIETISALLAQEWCKRGEEVIVATDVAHDPEQARSFPFQVIYQPSPGKWLTLLWWCDIYLQFNISLKATWPLLLIKRPLVVSHQSYYWISRDRTRDWRERLKVRIASSVTNIFASSAISKEVGSQGAVIHDPYDDALFHPNAASMRDTELAFVGRLVSDKGADCLLQALALLKVRRLAPRLSIIGEGPERLQLEDLCSKLDLCDQVCFWGAKPQAEVSALLQRHRILVVPSLWAEPFGVVALEGLASGCVVIVSESGGLPEAAGPCGLTFPNGDAKALAEKLELVLTDQKYAESLLEQVVSHLAKHRPAVVAERYLRVMRQAFEGRN